MLTRSGMIALILFFHCSLGANTITVGKNLSVKSIAQALTLVKNGDSILVKKGTYHEKTLMIKQSITLFTKESAKIDAQGVANDLLVIFADNVRIKGFQFVNVGVSFLKEAAAIRLVHCKNVIVENNKIDSCFFGIYIEQAKNSIISDNQIRGAFKDEASAGNAIHAWKGKALSICNNFITGHRDGIYFEFVNNSFIENNKSQYNLRYGLHFMFSNDDGYENNIFQDNGAGVAVMFSRNIIMRNNQFIHNWGGASYGLLLKEISDGSIDKNQFIENTIGIMAEGANRLTISNNKFMLNGTAMDIKGNCLDNKIIQNDFVANTFEVVTNSKQNNNFFNENYWSNYSGYDLNRDSFGDIAYRPVNLFAKITNEVPSATFLLHSPFVRLMEIGEKIFPQFIPQSLMDKRPKIKPYADD
ncbi:MAG TPA: nitrous oxide reductase family maturation protein NosD [Saprospiraceae bacterium]|nr:nitrous oxide reductase family maturation protein NosD [Saprospiraceae bacterium]HPN69637.1 nitrous oxide reductase family maturation protein NosD [Saprospiraceae bacterium]